MKYLAFLALINLAFSLMAQQPSIHETQLNYYNSLGHSPSYYTELNQAQSQLKSKSNVNRAGCNLNKIVFGWHPYWSNGKEDQYQWDLMSDLSFFSYEVDAATGNANSTHGWATNNAVDSALAHGLRVNLCVTLFSNHSTFFNTPGAQQTLITNLINLVQSRGAHGVNIDFEGIASSQKTNFTNFMIDLCNQMHTAIPGSQVSTVLYAVDWNNIFDITALDPYVDLYTIMGYAYYYSNSGNAGPTDPLYHFGSSYNYTLSKTVTDYLDKGADPNKLVLGLPYYGYEYPTVSTAIPSATSGSGYAVTFQQIMNNTSGNYSAANETWEYNTFSTNYTFNSGGTHQAFINDEFDMSERLEFINHRDIAGMAIWALGYDYNYTDYWSAIEDNFTDCAVHPCSDTLYDMGGPTRDYYDDENYTYTITADNASSINLAFDTIDIEATYDFLYVYDGPTTASPQIPGSPFSGQYAGFNWTSSSNAVTFRFTSDGATNNDGWKIVYTCNQDTEAPSTSIDSGNNWETQDFNVSYTDTDVGMGVDKCFYLVSDFDGSEWRANADNGFVLDNFNNLSANWTNQTGTWQTSGGILEQGDENQSNSNLWMDVDQDNTGQYLYEWDALMTGNLTNRRSGIHFFCDDPTLPNRGNSYFVYFRVDSDKSQVYKVVNDVWTLVSDDPVTLDPGTWYNYKVYFDPQTGLIKTYVNDQLASSYTDPNPHQSGNSVSYRTGGCQMAADNLKVYKSRSASTLVSVGNPSADVRFQNQDPTTPSCEIYSICLDSANLWSAIDSDLINVDWTEAGPLVPIDGFSVDKDTFFDPNQITGQWQAYQDTQSLTLAYYYAIGDAPGDSNIVAWTNNGLNTIFTETGLSLNYNTVYYVSVRSENGAGIISNHYTTDGQILLNANGIDENQVLSAMVFPNPASNILHLRLNEMTKSKMDLRLYSLDGSLVLQDEIGISESEIELNIEQLSSGKYHLVLSGKEQVIRLDVIKL